MTIDLLTRVAQGLYGPCWRAPLGTALGVNERTVRRWATGESAIPDLRADLARLIDEHIAYLRELRRGI